MKTADKKCPILEALKVHWSDPAEGNGSKDYIKNYCITCPLEKCIYDRRYLPDVKAELIEIALDLGGKWELSEEETERLIKAQELLEVMNG